MKQEKDYFEKELFGLNQQKSAASAGIGIGDLLCIVFVVLKLCHIIEWSWVWVLSPVWIPLLIVILCVILLKVLK